MSMIAYANANHARCQDTRRSRSGSAQFLAKHIDVRYYFIKDQVENGIMELYFVQTECQLADIFTKRVLRERFNFLIKKLGELATACVSYEVTKFLMDDRNSTSTSDPTPLTLEELKTELCSITFGDLSIEAYFKKVESLMTILASLDSPVLEDDVAHYVLAGLPPTMAFHTGLAMIPPGFAASQPYFGPLGFPSQPFGSPYPPAHVTHPNGTQQPNGANAFPAILVDRAGFPAQPFGSPYPPAHVTHPNGTQQPNGANGSLIGPTLLSGQATSLPHAFNAETLQDPTNSAWNMDSGASTHLNSSINRLSEIFNNCMYSSVSVGDGHTIPVTNVGHSLLPTNYGSLCLNNVLITPHIVKNLIFVRQFVRDNKCTIEFDAFGFSVKDFISRRCFSNMIARGISTRSHLLLLFCMRYLSVNIRGINILDI
ncbi:hypothetical protein Tco_0585696 [Tanacetum coccineum]